MNRSHHRDIISLDVTFYFHIQRFCFESYGEIQLWLKTCFDVDVSYRTVHELVRYKLKAKLKVPRLLHIKQSEKAVEQSKKTSISIKNNSKFG